MKHKHLTPVAVLANHVVTVSIICFTDLCNPIEIYIDARKKHPFTRHPAAKHLKHSNFAVTDIRENPADLFSGATRASTLDPAIILRSWFPYKSFRSCRIYNSLYTRMLILELSTVQCAPSSWCRLSSAPVFSAPYSYWDSYPLFGFLVSFLIHNINLAVLNFCKDFNINVYLIIDSYNKLILRNAIYPLVKGKATFQKTRKIMANIFV